MGIIELTIARPRTASAFYAKKIEIYPKEEGKKEHWKAPP
jgi:hypothetical protein